MPAKKKKGDFRNLLILILLFVVGVESYLLWQKKGGEFTPGSQPRKQFTAARENPPVRKTPVTTSPVPKTTQPKINPASITPEPETTNAKIDPPVNRPVKPVATVKPAPSTATGSGKGAKIAIVLDDWGYNASHCDKLKEIEGPVTVAVLPHLPHSRDIANCAYQYQKEVMLHFPMEPHWNMDKYPEDYIVKTSMTRTKVEKLLDDAIASVPHLVGINNHMGSKATEDRRLLSIIFERLKTRRLFFVDSYVTNQSIADSVAKDKEVRFARRDVFLDNQNERAYIEKQFAEVARIAKEKGTAIAIGHDRTLTLEIVKEQTKLLRSQGFEIVPVNHLIEAQ